MLRLPGNERAQREASLLVTLGERRRVNHAAVDRDGRHRRQRRQHAAIDGREIDRIGWHRWDHAGRVQGRNNGGIRRWGDAAVGRPGAHQVGKVDLFTHPEKVLVDSVDAHSDRGGVAGESHDLGGMTQRFGGRRVSPGVYRVGQAVEMQPARHPHPGKKRQQGAD